MSENPSASDWAAERGGKWREQLAGMEAMLKPVDGPLIRALSLDAPGRIADIACGGGGTTLEIQRCAPTGAVVHGFDISPELIESARARTGADAVTFALADVATAPVPEQPYDRLVSRFGVMFFDDPSAAFANLSRWLTPGGRFAFAVWGRPADNPWATTVRDVVAGLVEVPSQDPQAPGLFRYAGADTLLGLLEGAGLADLDVQDWRGALPVGGGLPPREAAGFALAAFSAGEHLATAREPVVEEAHHSLAARFSRHQRDGAVWMEAGVHIVTGVRPG